MMMEFVATTAANCAGGSSSATPSPHPSNPSQPAFSFFQTQENSFRSHPNRLYSANDLLHTPPSYPYESFKVRDRPRSAEGPSRCSTEAASPKSPLFASRSAIASTASPASLISESMAVASSTPPISFDYPTPVSALSFPAPGFYSHEPTPTSHAPASVLAALNTPAPTGLGVSNTLHSSSTQSSFVPWVSHNSPSVSNQTLGSRFPSGSSHPASDTVNSDSGSRRWTPEQSEYPQPPSRLQPGSTEHSQSLPALGSPVAIEQPNSPSFFISYPEGLPPGAHDSEGAPQNCGSDELQSRVRLNHHLSGAYEPLKSSVRSGNARAQGYSGNVTADHTSFDQNSLGLCSPIPHQGSSIPLGNGLSNIGGPPVWLEPEILSAPFEESNANPHPASEYHPSITSVNNLSSPSVSTFFPAQEVDRSSLLLKPSNRTTHCIKLNTSKVEPTYINSQGNDNKNLSLESPLPRAEGPFPNVNNPRMNSMSKKKKREVKEDEAICGGCGAWMARLTLRGSAEELSVVGGYEILHTCKRCQEQRRSDCSDIRGILRDSNAGFTQIMPMERPDFNHRMKPELTVQTVPTTFRKRNRRTDDVTAPTTCDCCARQLGVGGIVPRNGRSAIQFAVEVVCVHCVQNFRRCTDCGGGGGSRLGVGKWRCKELFSDGRRTCVLSHQRQGASTETKTVVWRISDIIEKVELDTLVCQLKELLKHSLYAALATPEMLESGLARVSNFEGIRNMYINGWKQVEPLIREDVELKFGRRRYLGLKWTKPHPRKGSKRLSPGASNDSQKLKNQPDILLEPGKDLSGFVLSEWDMKNGTLFVSVAMPWQSGDALESTASLAHKTLLEARADREKMIESLSKQRALSATEVAKLYPPIEHLWTLLFFSREARLVQFLEKRRKFLPLEDYLTQYPDAHRSMFPPERDCYVPVEEQAGWTVWVRREPATSLNTKK